ncbi:MAG TPA: hypothetical protein VMM60_05475, partial [Ilumatobacter sp.]|nr:hypothetical protein [Ilumatobacter sp.]
MSDNWGQVFPGFDHPVRGQVSSYTAASQACLTLKSVTETCGTEFHRLCSSESLDQLGGAAAEQLVTLVTQIDGSFAQVPPVFQSLADVFTKHAQRLEELRAQSAWALAVAHTRWATVT